MGKAIAFPFCRHLNVTVSEAQVEYRWFCFLIVVLSSKPYSAGTMIHDPGGSTMQHILNTAGIIQSVSHVNIN